MTNLLTNTEEKLLLSWAYPSKICLLPLKAPLKDISSLGNDMGLLHPI